MQKSFKEWEGRKFPIRKVTLPETLGGYEVNVADEELWELIKNACDIWFHPKHKEAVAIDESIYYYCQDGFISSDPTDEEIIAYLIENG